MGIEWANQDRKYAFNVAKQGYKRYASACMQAGRSIEELDQLITNALFPQLANLIADDLREGGQHNAKYDEEGNQFLFVDNFMFINCTLICADKTANAFARIKSSLPLNDAYNIGEESARFLGMIKDFHYMTTHDFAEKYRAPYADISGFLVYMTSSSPDERSLSYDELSADGTAKWKGASIRWLSEYVDRYYDHIRDETLRKFKVQDGELILRDINPVNGTLLTTENKIPIEGIGIEYECTRRSKNEGYKLSAYTLIAYNGDSEYYISEKIMLDNDNTRFGMYIDDAVKEYGNLMAWMEANGLPDDE